MTEQEYINATNKAKLGAARLMLADIDLDDLETDDAKDLRAARILLTKVDSMLQIYIDIEESQ